MEEFVWGLRPPSQSVVSTQRNHNALSWPFASTIRVDRHREHLELGRLHCCLTVFHGRYVGLRLLHEDLKIFFELYLNTFIHLYALILLLGWWSPLQLPPWHGPITLANSTASQTSLREFRHLRLEYICTSVWERSTKSTCFCCHSVVISPPSEVYLG